MKPIKFAILPLAVLLFAACSSNKTTLPYFTDIATLQEGELPDFNYRATIQPDDELMITITSSIPGATAPYNYTMSNSTTTTTLGETSNLKQLSYIVNSKGDITMPVLGTIHVAGLTVEQLQDKITELVRKDVSDAAVKVEMLNFHVYVIGEIGRPSRLNVRSNHYSILDAISEAGDLTQYGERSNILIIREENGKRVFKRLDLNSSDIFASPYFYLKQNDYIYVEPNKVLQSNARYNTNNAYKLQVAATIVSASSVLISLLIALVIK